MVVGGPPSSLKQLKVDRLWWTKGYKSIVFILIELFLIMIKKNVP